METINPQEWKQDLPAFKEKTDQFYAGELSKADYKGFSGGYGSYAQKDGKASMIRLRMSGGHLTKDKLKFIADSIKTYNVDKVHLTTCQTIQLHNLQPEAIYGIMEGGLDHGIVTMGGGGDFPRNVTVSPLSGVEKGEYFNVLPYAEAAGEYLMTFIKKEVMPRKLKVGFSNGPANETHATFRDLGFVAREDGNFDVYSAGGLGNNARFGLKVAENVQPEKILYYICAMRETFIAHGNYKQRGRARTRYMQETLGEEGYIKAFHEKLDEVFASGQDLDLHVEISEVKKQGDGSKVSGKRVIDQKQEGLYAVSYHPFGGCPKPEKLGEIYDVIKDMDEVEARISPDETMYIINLTGDEAKKVLDKTGQKYGHKFNYEEVLMGGISIDTYGVPLTDEALETAKKSDAVLLGAVGGNVGNSRWYDVAPNLRPEAGLLAIRKGLNLFANIRPAYLYNDLAGACPLKQEIIGDGFDMVIVRELTGGLYFGERHTETVNGVEQATDTLVYSEKEIRRVAIKAFEIAMKRKKKVTSVDKANVLDSSRLWRKVVAEVAKDYPEVTLENMLVDNCAMQLVMNPRQFDVILTENMFGDILSDEASMITGSIGMLSSASLNESKFGLYEPSHGSAPDIAGKDIANPIATILSAAMMLRFSFDLDKEADAIEDAVRKVLAEGYRTVDIMDEGKKQVGTTEMGNLICERI